MLYDTISLYAMRLSHVILYAISLYDLSLYSKRGRCKNFVNRSINTGAELFNTKVKVFRSQFSGVTDIPFLLFRFSKLCA